MEEKIRLLNPWWREGKVPKRLLYIKKRFVFENLVKLLEHERILALIGPRRTGKSTLLFQLISHLLEKGVKPEQLFYLSMEDIDLALEKAIEFYEKNVLRKSLETAEKVYIFLDEVQYSEKWDIILKGYYDLKYPVKFVVSGSSSIYIAKKSRESLHGRIIEEYILPMGFLEYMMFANEKLFMKIRYLEKFGKPFLDQDLEHMIQNKFELTKYSKEIEIAFMDYLLRGGYIAYVFEDNDLMRSRLMRSDIIDKAIYKDITKIYDVRTPEILEKILLYIAEQTSSILNQSTLSSDMRISYPSLLNYMFYLKNSYLIYDALNFSKSVKRTIRANKKVYISDTGVRAAVTGENYVSDANAGRILETAVFNHFKVMTVADQLKTYYWRRKHEVDIVLKINKKLLPVEVKYKDAIGKEDIIGLKKFMKDFKADKGVIVTKNTFELRTEDINGKKAYLLLIPAWLVLCFGCEKG